MVTIYDIAKKAGCSPATVSKAFNNYKGVNAKTYKKIMDTAKNMGYTPNNTARALATKKNWLLGVLFSEDMGMGITHPHYSEILQSFKYRAEELGYDMVFVNKRLGERNLSYFEHIKYRGVDGVLIAVGHKEYEDIKVILESDIPCVSIESIYPGKTVVLSDNRMGSFQALEHLYLLGHRKIAHISGPLSSVAGTERYNAYLEFMEKKGLHVNSKHIVESESYSYQDGQKAAVKLMQQSWDDMPSAIYVSYDEMAFSTISVVKEYGFRVPEDISVVGFDNLRMSGYYVASFIDPPLTTIEQDRSGIGKAAADILVDLVEDKAKQEGNIVRFNTKLIARYSTQRIDNP